MLHAQQNVLFQPQVVQLLMLDHHVLSDALHCQELLALLVLNKVDFTERALTENLLDVEVFKRGFYTLTFRCVQCVAPLLSVHHISICCQLCCSSLRFLECSHSVRNIVFHSVLIIVVDWPI